MTLTLVTIAVATHGFIELIPPTTPVLDTLCVATHGFICGVEDLPQKPPRGIENPERVGAGVLPIPLLASREDALLPMLVSAVYETAILASQVDVVRTGDITFPDQPAGFDSERLFPPSGVLSPARLGDDC